MTFTYVCGLGAVSLQDLDDPDDEDDDDDDDEDKDDDDDDDEDDEDDGEDDDEEEEETWQVSKSISSAKGPAMLDFGRRTARLSAISQLS